MMTLLRVTSYGEEKKVSTPLRTISSKLISLSRNRVLRTMRLKIKRALMEKTCLEKHLFLWEIEAIKSSQMLFLIRTTSVRHLRQP